MRILTILLFILACEPSSKPNYELIAHPSGSVRHNLIVVGRYRGSTRARGFTGASPANAPVQLAAGAKQVNTISDTHGRFDMMLPGTASHATLTIAGQTTRYRVRDIEAALQQIAEPRIPTGNTPNDIVMDGDTIYVPSSMSRELHAFTPEGRRSVYFAPGSAPWSAALSPAGQSVAVTLQGTHEVALIDKLSLKVTSSAAVRDARAPQGLLFDGGTLFVTFTNLIKAAARPGDTTQYGPGILAAFDITEEKIQYRSHVELPVKNPTQIIKSPQGQIWIVCGGVFQYDMNKQFSLAEPASLLRLEDMLVKEQIDLGRQFLPGIPSFVGDRIFVGNMLAPELLILPERTITNGGLSLADGWFPATLARPGDLLWIVDAKRDRLIVVDTLTNEWNPWPFSEGIPIARRLGDEIFKGAQNVVASDEKAYVVLNGSSEIAPLSMMRLMGP